MGKRKKYTAEEKIKILREVLEDGKSISQTADCYRLRPNNIFKWRKRLFEEGVQAFWIKMDDISGKAEDRKITALQSLLRKTLLCPPKPRKQPERYAKCQINYLGY